MATKGRNGRRIRTLDQLAKMEGGSVFVSAWDKPTSVAFIVSMQFRVVALFLKRGIYEYKKPEPKQ